MIGKLLRSDNSERPNGLGLPLDQFISPVIAKAARVLLPPLVLAIVAAGVIAGMIAGVIGRVFA